MKQRLIRICFLLEIDKKTRGLESMGDVQAIMNFEFLPNEILF
jgi:hypothetical protein